jgi:hypothetical protein
MDIAPCLKGTIIDFETTHWDAEKGELLTAGFLSEECDKLFKNAKTMNAQGW